MLVKMKYVTARPSLKNPERWYWQKPGHALVRLPGDPAARWAMVERLNAPQKPELASSVAGVIGLYRKSEQWKSLTVSSRRAYDGILRWMEQNKSWKDTHIVGLTRVALVDWLDAEPKLGMRRLKRAVVLNLLNLAHDRGIIPSNPAIGLKLPPGGGRKQVWSVDDEKTFLAACKKERLRRAFLLQLYTGQRAGDCLAMNLTQVSNWTVKVKQEKTDAMVAIPLHTTLREALETPIPSLMLAGYPGGEKSRYAAYNRDFRMARKEAKLGHLQARDLRRTAVVRLAEAGCTVPEIAAVTGHSIAQTQSIIDTYFVRTAPMAKNAMDKWDRKKPDDSAQR